MTPVANHKRAHKQNSKTVKLFWLFGYITTFRGGGEVFQTLAAKASS